jgi:lipoprotein-releasing system ATP-binding protein
MFVQLENVSKSYRSPESGEAVEVVRGLDLDIGEGERVAILGPSGSGKSTVLNLIGALDQADGGKIVVAGEDLAQFDESRRAHFRNETIGFVFQLHHLLPQCTIIENVLVPTLAASGRAREGVEARALDLLKAVGLQDRAQHRPGQLSGGERQRAAVARALINKPRLLLADEPTGSLDRASARRLADLLIELNQSERITLLIVTHALDLAEEMERVFTFEDRKLVEKSRASKK